MTLSIVNLKCKFANETKSEIGFEFEFKVEAIFEL